MLSMLGLAIALAMDATAVAAARGLAGGVSRRDVVLVPALFGGFQAGMAALGWLGATWLGPAIARWDHWIGAALLTALGVKMVIGALAHKPDAAAEEPSARDDLITLLGLALATSIDAAAAGVTLPMLDAPPLLSLVAIGVVTAALSAAGLALGRRAGEAMGPRLEVVGGLALIAIAIKLLVDHLGA
ncbi:MAG: manganese efflux pump MntP family protein [Deltaproteobacteria bacterium]|nr:manganese efflux pump MntP family protein [Deltaproteobacteria bacterium]